MNMENKIDPNQPAFSRSAFAIDTWEDSDRGAQGLTIRQYYAGLALQGLCANPNPHIKDWESDTVSFYVHAAVKIADALIAELNKEQ